MSEAIPPCTPVLPRSAPSTAAPSHTSDLCGSHFPSTSLGEVTSLNCVTKNFQQHNQAHLMQQSQQPWQNYQSRAEGHPPTFNTVFKPIVSNLVTPAKTTLSLAFKSSTPFVNLPSQTHFPAPQSHEIFNFVKASASFVLRPYSVSHDLNPTLKVQNPDGSSDGGGYGVYHDTSAKPMFACEASRSQDDDLKSVYNHIIQNGSVDVRGDGGFSETAVLPNLAHPPSTTQDQDSVDRDNHPTQLQDLLRMLECLRRSNVSPTSGVYKSIQAGIFTLTQQRPPPRQQPPDKSAFSFAAKGLEASPSTTSDSTPLLPFTHTPAHLHPSLNQHLPECTPLPSSQCVSFNTYSFTDFHAPTPKENGRFKLAVVTETPCSQSHLRLQNRPHLDVTSADEVSSTLSQHVSLSNEYTDVEGFAPAPRSLGGMTCSAICGQSPLFPHCNAASPENENSRNSRTTPYATASCGNSDTPHTTVLNQSSNEDIKVKATIRSDPTFLHGGRMKGIESAQTSLPTLTSNSSRASPPFPPWFQLLPPHVVTSLPPTILRSPIFASHLLTQYNQYLQRRQQQIEHHILLHQNQYSPTEAFSISSPQPPQQQHPQQLQLQLQALQRYQQQQQDYLHQEYDQSNQTRQNQHLHQLQQLMQTKLLLKAQVGEQKIVSSQVCLESLPIESDEGLQDTKKRASCLISNAGGQTEKDQLVKKGRRCKSKIRESSVKKNDTSDRKTGQDTDDLTHPGVDGECNQTDDVENGKEAADNGMSKSTARRSTTTRSREITKRKDRRCSSRNLWSEANIRGSNINRLFVKSKGSPVDTLEKRNRGLHAHCRRFFTKRKCGWKGRSGKAASQSQVYGRKFNDSDDDGSRAFLDKSDCDEIETEEEEDDEEEGWVPPRSFSMKISKKSTMKKWRPKRIDHLEGDDSSRVDGVTQSDDGPAAGQGVLALRNTNNDDDGGKDCDDRNCCNDDTDDCAPVYSPPRTRSYRNLLSASSCRDRNPGDSPGHSGAFGDTCLDKRAKEKSLRTNPPPTPTFMLSVTEYHLMSHGEDDRVDHSKGMPEKRLVMDVDPQRHAEEWNRFYSRHVDATEPFNAFTAADAAKLLFLKLSKKEFFITDDDIVVEVGHGSCPLCVHFLAVFKTVGKRYVGIECSTAAARLALGMEIVDWQNSPFDKRDDPSEATNDDDGDDLLSVCNNDAGINPRAQINDGFQKKSARLSCHLPSKIVFKREGNSSLLREQTNTTVKKIFRSEGDQGNAGDAETKEVDQVVMEYREIVSVGSPNCEVNGEFQDRSNTTRVSSTISDSALVGEKGERNTPFPSDNAMMKIDGKTYESPSSDADKPRELPIVHQSLVERHRLRDEIQSISDSYVHPSTPKVLSLMSSPLDRPQCSTSVPALKFCTETAYKSSSSAPLSSSAAPPSPSSSPLASSPPCGPRKEDVKSHIESIANESGVRLENIGGGRHLHTTSLTSTSTLGDFCIAASSKPALLRLYQNSSAHQASDSISLSVSCPTPQGPLATVPPTSHCPGLDTVDGHEAKMSPIDSFFPYPERSSSISPPVEAPPSKLSAPPEVSAVGCARNTEYCAQQPSSPSFLSSSTEYAGHGQVVEIQSRVVVEDAISEPLQRLFSEKEETEQRKIRMEINGSENAAVSRESHTPVDAEMAEVTDRSYCTDFSSSPVCRVKTPSLSNFSVVSSEFGERSNSNSQKVGVDGPVSSDLESRGDEPIGLDQDVSRKNGRGGGANHDVPPSLQYYQGTLEPALQVSWATSEGKNKTVESGEMKSQPKKGVRPSAVTSTSRCGELEGAKKKQRHERKCKQPISHGATETYAGRVSSHEHRLSDDVRKLRQLHQLGRVEFLVVSKGFDYWGSLEMNDRTGTGNGNQRGGENDPDDSHEEYVDSGIFCGFPAIALRSSDHNYFPFVPLKASSTSSGSENPSPSLSPPHASVYRPSACTSSLHDTGSRQIPEYTISRVTSTPPTTIVGGSICDNLLGQKSVGDRKSADASASAGVVPYDEVLLGAGNLGLLGKPEQNANPKEVNVTRDGGKAKYCSNSSGKSISSCGRALRDSFGSSLLPAALAIEQNSYTPTTIPIRKMSDESTASSLDTHPFPTSSADLALSSPPSNSSLSTVPVSPSPSPSNVICAPPSPASSAGASTFSYFLKNSARYVLAKSTLDSMTCMLPYTGLAVDWTDDLRIPRGMVAWFDSMAQCLLLPHPPDEHPPQRLSSSPGNPNECGNLMEKRSGWVQHERKGVGRGGKQSRALKMTSKLQSRCTAAATNGSSDCIHYECGSGTSDDRPRRPSPKLILIEPHDKARIHLLTIFKVIHSATFNTRSPARFLRLSRIFSHREVDRAIGYCIERRPIFFESFDDLYADMVSVCRPLLKREREWEDDFFPTVEPPKWRSDDPSHIEILKSVEWNPQTVESSCGTRGKASTRLEKERADRRCRVT